MWSMCSMSLYYVQMAKTNKQANIKYICGNIIQLAISFCMLQFKLADSHWLKIYRIMENFMLSGIG